MQDERIEFVMKLRLRRIITAVLFACNITASASAPSSWAQNEIALAKEAGLDCFEGFDKSFTAPVTREEICSLVAQTIELSDITTDDIDENPFSDTDSESILTVYGLGIISGTGEGTFLPDREVTRQEAAKIFSNAINIITTYQNRYKSSLYTTFADADAIAAWAREYVSHTADLGLFKGDESGNFNPLGSVTLEQSVALCMRTLKMTDIRNAPAEDEIALSAYVNKDTAVISWEGSGDFEVTVSESRRSYYSGEFPPNVTAMTVSGGELTLSVCPNKDYTVTVSGKNHDSGSVTFTTENYAADAQHRLEVRETVDTFTSEEDSSAMMKTITVDVWQLNGDEKTPSTLDITVYEGIADRVRAVFDEIFAGDEKFPIYSVGAYAWRAPMASGRLSEHNLGTAIDINPDHNYCLYSDGSSVGSLYLPYENPYSITPYGDVVRAFERYGFTWGADSWRSPKDYMHFSYLGT